MLRAWLDWPALLTRMSTPPNVFTAHAPSSRASWGFVRSHVLLAAVPLSRWISATTCSSGSLRRPATATRAPSAASMRAVARPMPVPAPVTSAILPSSVLLIWSLPLSRHHAGRKSTEQLAPLIPDCFLSKAHLASHLRRYHHRA